MYALHRLRVVGYVFLSMTFLCCGSSDKPTEVEVSWEVPQGDEDGLLMHYATHMTANPQDTAAIEQNELIEFLVEKGWQMEHDPAGIFYHVIEPGSGVIPEWGSRVQVHYHGYALDGRKFDSTYDRDEPFTFYVGNVVRGWNLSLYHLKPGGRGVFLIPAHLAYGSEGFGRLVGPNEHLLFEIELLKIVEEKRD